MRILLTADEGLFTEYGEKWWRGYVTCFPVEMICISTFDWYCPRISSEGEIAKRAPLSLRVIESVLRSSCCSESEVACVDPMNLEHFVGEDTELVCVSVIDPLGLGYITRSVSSHYGGTPYSRFLFYRLMRRIASLRASHDFMTLVGGPGAWQLKNDELMGDLGIDFLVIGESERVLTTLVLDLLSGSIPTCRIWKGEKPIVSEILPIRGPATNGMIEVSRGCSRHCAFCATEYGRRDIELSTIVHSTTATVRGGSKHLTLQSDDPLTYGSRRHEPDSDAVVGLLKETREAGAQNISLLHTTFSSVASEPLLFSLDRKCFVDYSRAHQTQHQQEIWIVVIYKVMVASGQSAGTFKFFAKCSGNSKQVLASQQKLFDSGTGIWIPPSALQKRAILIHRVLQHHSVFGIHHHCFTNQPSINIFNLTHVL
jgi:hypothetical protein